MTDRRIYRVVQWATGNVGRNAVEGVLAHPDLQLVGAYTYDAAKSGRDVGELCGIAPIGVTATNDVDEVLGIDADCVLYAPMLPNTGEVLRIVAAGRNLVTPTGWFFPFRAHDVAELEGACRQAGVSVHGTGINPGGITEQLPLMLSGYCRDIRHVRAEEFSDIRTYASEFVVREIMLFGKPPAEAAESPMLQILGDGFGQSIDMVAEALGWELDADKPATIETAVCTAPIDTPVGVLDAGTVAAQRLTWEGTVDGTAVVTVRVNWLMGTDHLDPAWDFGPEGERFEVAFDAVPPVSASFHGMHPASLDDDLDRNPGIIATAMHCVNSIPAVVDADPGIRTYLDLPLMPGRAAVT
jgi:hypothetical protein